MLRALVRPHHGGSGVNSSWEAGEEIIRKRQEKGQNILRWDNGGIDFDTKSKGVDINHRLGFEARKNGPLNGSAIGNSFDRVDVLAFCQSYLSTAFGPLEFLQVHQPGRF